VTYTPGGSAERGRGARPNSTPRTAGRMAGEQERERSGGVGTSPPAERRSRDVHAARERGTSTRGAAELDPASAGELAGEQGNRTLHPMVAHGVSDFEDRGGHQSAILSRERRVKGTSSSGRCNRGGRVRSPRGWRGLTLVLRSGRSGCQPGGRGQDLVPQPRKESGLPVSEGSAQRTGSRDDERRYPAHLNTTFTSHLSEHGAAPSAWSRALAAGRDRDSSPRVPGAAPHDAAGEAPSRIIELSTIAFDSSMQVKGDDQASGRDPGGPRPALASSRGCRARGAPGGQDDPRAADRAGTGGSSTDLRSGGSGGPPPP